MIRSVNIECQIVGEKIQLWVKYSNDQGRPWPFDCGLLPESVEIMEIVDMSGEGDLAFNADQFSAILDACREAIACWCMLVRSGHG
jgi:hypothetical protein